MENDFNLEDKEKFRINPHVWLQTLLAITGDKEKKREMVQTVSEKTGFTPPQVEQILATTISQLIKETRLN
ncbi:MAG TPA: hypothetical protein VK900_10190 [Anaerolineales bacterium]|nr:hypothetical protein [Anaerolineales bacterium]